MQYVAAKLATLAFVAREVAFRGGNTGSKTCKATKLSDKLQENVARITWP